MVIFRPALMVTEIEISVYNGRKLDKNFKFIRLRSTLSRLLSGVMRQTGYLGVSTRRVESIGSNSDGRYTLSDRYTQRFRFQLS